MAPWLTIWFQPRHTLRKQLLQDPHYGLIFLAVVTGLIHGIGWIFYTWDQYPFADPLQRFNLIVASLCAGVVYAVFNLYLVGWLYTWTGSWIGGKGTFTQLKCAVGWSYYPFLMTGLLSVLENFEFSPNIQTVIGMLLIISSVWALIILFQLIAEAHQFTFGKGALTFLLTLMVVLLALFILAFGTALYRFFIILN